MHQNYPPFYPSLPAITPYRRRSIITRAPPLFSSPPLSLSFLFPISCQMVPSVLIEAIARAHHAKVKCVSMGTKARARGLARGCICCDGSCADSARFGRTPKQSGTYVQTSKPQTNDENRFGKVLMNTTISPQKRTTLAVVPPPSRLAFTPTSR